LVRQIAAAPLPWDDETGAETHWNFAIDTPPSVVVFGAGPESALLIPTLRALGWTVCVVDRRSRWRAMTALGDNAVHESPATAISMLLGQRFTAALVMHHNFELDREALSALADGAIPFIGLLGPNRRREDLLQLLSASECERLTTRLRSPVGIDLGGRGPEAIALSIVAQLHRHLHES
jgi:xanthine dehydrogenase accessory factor